jgi:ligand-binding sensor domain-containing protein
VISVAADAVAVDQWATLTSFNNARRMKLIDDTIYIATSGGLLVAADPNQPPSMYNNLNGLGTIDISDVIKDAAGQLWVAGFGRVVKFDGMQSVQFPFIDNGGDRFQVYSLADDGDYLWVGTQLGLVLFSKIDDGGQIQDSYGQFGDLNSQPAVYDIAIDGDSIWLATSAGLAVGLKTDPVALKAPSAWTVFGPANFPVIGTGSMSRLALYETSVYVGTARSAFRLDRTPLDTTFTELTIGQDSSFTDLKIENDTLFMYYAGGVGVVKNSVASYLPLSGLPSKGTVTGLNTGTYR